MTSRLHINQLTKTYRNGDAPAVRQVSFDLQQGMLLALVGASGSGKSTLLRLLAGLESPDDGDITLDGRCISSPRHSLPPEERGIGLVFQHHALFPHLTVEKNVAFGLHKLPAKQRKEKIAPLLKLVGLTDLRHRYPHELSGGERQRVALARALAPDPQLVLLDEPFSSLDAKLRQNVRDETKEILRQRNATAIFVTHDTGDALSIADQLVVLKQGEVQQQGTPHEVYHAPHNAYVASFLGACNFLPQIPLPDFCKGCIYATVGPPAIQQTADASGKALWIRPEHLRLRPISTATTESRILHGVVQKITFQGSCQLVVLRCEPCPGCSFSITVCHHEHFPVHEGEHWAILPHTPATSPLALQPEWAS